MDFWDNMGEMWGYDIIGSESHPLKKAFKLYCEMKKEMMKEDEDNEDDEEEEEEEVLENLTCAQLKQRLRAINKPVGGRKADLIQRIREHEEQKEALFKED